MEYLPIDYISHQSSDSARVTISLRYVLNTNCFFQPQQLEWRNFAGLIAAGVALQSLDRKFIPLSHPPAELADPNNIDSEPENLSSIDGTILCQYCDPGVRPDSESG